MIINPTRVPAVNETTQLELRVLILAPFGRDAEETCRVLVNAGLDAVRCTSVAELCSEIPSGAAAALLAEEALDEEARDRLAITLAEQPTWSDFPILVMTSSGRHKNNGWQVLRGIEGTGHLSVLERPLRMITLVSTVQTAIRARQRQYQIRDTLAARERAEQALRESSETLERRVAERTAELEKRNEELQQFAFVASHDMQEPLRKIQTFADLASNDFGEQLGEEGRFYLDRIQNAAFRMSKVLADLLAFSRVATQQKPFTRTSVQAIMEDVLMDLDMTIAQANAIVEIDATVTFQADVNQLRQVLNQLVTNAIKFRREDVPPRVRISSELLNTNGEICRIAVEDNGIGFDQKYIERIFQPFGRLHGKAAYPGTGMGLAICRRIIDRHNGTITAESTPGEGSRFIIELPVRQNATPS